MRSRKETVFNSCSIGHSPSFGKTGFKRIPKPISKCFENRCGREQKGKAFAVHHVKYPVLYFIDPRTYTYISSW